MTQVVIPAGNAPELSEIPEHVRARLTITPVRTMAEVLEAALVTGRRRRRARPARIRRRRRRATEARTEPVTRCQWSEVRAASRSGGKTLSAGLATL